MSVALTLGKTAALVASSAVQTARRAALSGREFQVIFSLTSRRDGFITIFHRSLSLDLKGRVSAASTDSSLPLSLQEHLELMMRSASILDDAERFLKKIVALLCAAEPATYPLRYRKILELIQGFCRSDRDFEKALAKELRTSSSKKGVEREIYAKLRGDILNEVVYYDNSDSRSSYDFVGLEEGGL